MIYAFSRDGAVPVLRLLAPREQAQPRSGPLGVVRRGRRVHPVRAVPVEPRRPTRAVTSIAVIGLYVAYLIPVFLRRINGDGVQAGSVEAREVGARSSAGSPSSGWSSSACCSAAHLVTDHRASFNYTPVAVAGRSSASPESGTRVSARKWFKGPKIQGTRGGARGHRARTQHLAATRTPYPACGTFGRRSGSSRPSPQPLPGCGPIGDLPNLGSFSGTAGPLVSPRSGGAVAFEEHVEEPGSCWRDLADVHGAGVNRVMLYGPPGTGKTYAALHVGVGAAPAERLVCTEDLTTGEITGTWMPVGRGPVDLARGPGHPRLARRRRARRAPGGRRGRPGLGRRAGARCSRSPTRRVGAMAPPRERRVGRARPAVLRRHDDQPRGPRGPAARRCATASRWRSASTVPTRRGGRAVGSDLRAPALAGSLGEPGRRVSLRSFYAFDQLRRHCGRRARRRAGLRGRRGARRCSTRWPSAPWRERSPVYPELVTGREDGFGAGAWRVREGSTRRGEASCDLAERILEVPLGRDDDRAGRCARTS